MQEYLGLLIAAARSRIKQVVLAQVAQFGLAPQQFWMLTALREMPGMSQADLAERVRADAPTVSRTLGALLERGLVRSDPDPEDRRRSRVFLTAAGEQLASEVAAVAADVRAAVVDGMSAAEEAAVRRGLKRILDNLDRYAARVRGRRS
ncbi:MAG TPA: MarR family transcriptional regulator [Anaeromyxobacteraceae bacterium]|jgi:DNA-binding MarR family transcriptional regulator|nr:MarR family transcriptional regulator [Anaeromyxobacteraceae bacterium]